MTAARIWLTVTALAWAEGCDSNSRRHGRRLALGLWRGSFFSPRLAIATGLQVARDYQACAFRIRRAP
jgi:hypothetical protein